MICLLAVTAGYGIYSLANLNSAISALIAGPALRLETAENLSATQLRIARAQLNLATSETAEDIDKYIQASDRNRNLFNETLKKLQDLSATDEARKAWGEVATKAERLFRIDDAIRSAVRNGNADQALILAKGDGRAIIDDIEKNDPSARGGQ
ncbi:MCP four helix bundle domain-containing protein [Neorhizobium galegae]|nr:MCP four helix bundle domain-containing protein [Neorhizobium galegae]